MLNTTPYGAYFIFGSLNFTAAVLAWWIPETKGVSFQKFLIFCRKLLYRESSTDRIQISLERMDEIFGTADLSNIEDVGIAAKHARSKDDSLEVEHVHASKV